MITFATDSHFLIGYAHLTGGKPCQDFALTGVDGMAAYAIVSDGCSTGGLTDVGSRLLVLSTASAIREHWAANRLVGANTPLEIGVRQKLVIAASKQMLRLITDDMLATCAYSYIAPEGGYIHLQGDGVVAFRLLDGRTILHRYEWANNTPLYPAYADDNFRRFIAAHGGDLTAQLLTCERWEHLNGTFNQLDSESYTLSEGIRGITIPLDAETITNLDLIAVFSDGASQVENVDWKDAALQLLAFKSTEGEFAKRRLNRFVKDAAKAGRGPLDDIAYAVIRLVKEEEDGSAEG